MALVKCIYCYIHTFHLNLNFCFVYFHGLTCIFIAQWGEWRANSKQRTMYIPISRFILFAFFSLYEISKTFRKRFIRNLMAISFVFGCVLFFVWFNCFLYWHFNAAAYCLFQCLWIDLFKRYAKHNANAWTLLCNADELFEFCMMYFFRAWTWIVSILFAISNNFDATFSRFTSFFSLSPLIIDANVRWICGR